MDYRAYILDTEGHIIGVHEFEARDDDDALTQAKQYLNGHDLEVWQRHRLVARLMHRSN